MKMALEQLKGRIKQGERWRMTVEKRRYTLYHKIDIIKQLADLIDEKVDLRNPDKILRIDIIGKYAGVCFFTERNFLHNEIRHLDYEKLDLHFSRQYSLS